MIVIQRTSLKQARHSFFVFIIIFSTDFDTSVVELTNLEA